MKLRAHNGLGCTVPTGAIECQSMGTNVKTNAHLVGMQSVPIEYSFVEGEASSALLLERSLQLATGGINVTPARTTQKSWNSAVDQTFLKCRNIVG